MSTRSKRHGPRPVAKLPNEAAGVEHRAETICDAVEADKAHFSALPPIIPITRTDATLLHERIKLAASRVVGAVQAREEQVLVVKRDVGHILDVVQTVADTLPPEAARTFIESLHLFVSAHPQRAPKAELAATAGPSSGVVKLVALSLGRNVTYYFEYGLTQTEWTALTPASVANTFVTGLVAGKTYYFRFRALVKGAFRDYSQIVSFQVR